MEEKDIPIKNMFDFDEKIKVENFSDWLYRWFPIPYRFFRHQIPQFFSDVKWFCQKVVRKHHTSDLELWGLDSHLAKIILPKLLAFRARDLHGYPNDFSDWDEKSPGSMGLTKEEYDAAKAKGDYVGGGFDAWLHTLDEMIYGFEWFLYHEGYNRKEIKLKDAFYKKYNYLDPHRETDDNLTWGYNYLTPDGNHCYTSENNLEEKGYKMLSKSKSYYDSKLARVQVDRAQKGIELFGKYFMNLWD